MGLEEGSERARLRPPRKEAFQISPFFIWALQKRTLPPSVSLLAHEALPSMNSQVRFARNS